jgi:3-hydroxyisobutyrate dehydrogenase-like beta-hydroxyacid dehydrogenase
MEEIGFLGMGIMGKAMAMNLLRHGFKVTVWNRTLSRVPSLSLNMCVLIRTSVYVYLFI